MSDNDTSEITYDAINFDGLERRANYRVIAYREDILHYLDRKEAAAILFQIIYRWQTEYKRVEVLKEIDRRKKTNQPPLTAEEVEEMMWVHMSYNDFVRESGQALGYNTVIRMIDYLVNTKQALEQRENHDPRFPDYEYRVNKGLVKVFLKALPAAPAFTPKGTKKPPTTQMGTPDKHSTQMGTDYTQVGTGTTQMGRANTQMGTGLYPFGGTSQESTQRHTETSQDTSQEGAFAPTPALDLPNNVTVLSDSQKLRAMRQVPDWDEIDADRMHTTAKHAAVLKGGKDGQLDGAPAHGAPAGIPARPAGVSPVDMAARPVARSSGAGIPVAPVSPANLPQAASGRELERAAQSTPAAAVATQKRLSLKDETPRPSAKRQLESEIAHYYDIIEQELPGVVFSPSQRFKARNNIATIQAMIDDKLPDETLRKALKKLSAWERQNFNLKRFYEEWMPAKLASTSVTNGKGTPVNDEDVPYTFAWIQKQQAASA